MKPDRYGHYPVPVKPASGIMTWTHWPEDVVDRLREWNGRHRGLSFNGHAVFKCPDCNLFCAPQPYGTATIHGDPLCDDCLIARARRANVKAEKFRPRGRPNWMGSCICTLEVNPVTGTYIDGIRSDCTYHRAAAHDPLNHSIPWNCPTYWDGCNCLLPQHCKPT